LIDQLGQAEPIALVCALFGVTRSCLYAHRQRRDRIDTPRMALRSQVHPLFVDSRSSAGSRSIMGMMREEGSSIGRFKVGRLMAELGLICKQPGNHAYKQATVERVDVPNRLNRQFDVEAPNRVWCGDITFVWAQGRWHYLAAVLDLFTRRIVGWAFSTRPDADLVVKALEMAFEQRGRPSAVMFHSDQGSQGGFNRSSQHWVAEHILGTHLMPPPVSSSRASFGAWCSARGQRLRSLVRSTGTGQCPLGSIASGGRSYSRWYRAAMDYADLKRRL
jgi:transposase InsO family protein